MYMIITRNGNYTTSSNVFVQGRDNIEIDQHSFELACRLAYHGLLNFETQIVCAKIITEAFGTDAEYAVYAAMLLDTAQLQHVLGPKKNRPEVIVLSCL